MGEADERTKKVERLDVLAHVATGHGLAHQRLHGPQDQASRAFEQPGRAAGDGVERGGDDPFGRHMVDEQQHPGPQRRKPRHRPREASGRQGQLLDFGPVDRLDERVPGGKVPVQGSRADFRQPGDFFEARVRA